jgi:hypothetical protein
MTTKLKATIHKVKGFTLTLYYDGETIYSDIKNGVYTGSLSVAENEGCLENQSGTATLPVPESVVEKFWAFEQAFSDSL